MAEKLFLCSQPREVKNDQIYFNYEIMINAQSIHSISIDFVGLRGFENLFLRLGF